MMNVWHGGQMMKKTGVIGRVDELRKSAVFNFAFVGHPDVNGFADDEFAFLLFFVFQEELCS